MKKYFLLILILLSFFYIRCGYAKENVNSLIYNTFFKEMVRISIFKVGSSIDISNDAEISGSDKVYIFKKEMKNITVLKKYSSEPNYGGVFKTENFRLMFMFVKISNENHKVLELLYSTKDGIMIVREGDIFPDKKPKTFDEKISVYEFKIPKKINNLLKQRENKLPEEGFFLNTWSENFSQ